MDRQAEQTDPRRQMAAAVALQRGGKHEAALPIYRELMSKWPDFADAFHFGGLAAHALGKEAEAREWLLTAERLSPQRADFLLNSARYFVEVGEPEEAESRALRAYRADPRNPNALFQYANVLNCLNRGDEIVAEMERLAQAYSMDSGIWLLLARCQLQAGDRPRAKNSYARACRNTHESVAARLDYADFLCGNKDLEEAEQEFEIVLAEGEPFQRALAEYGLAVIAAQRGDKRATCSHAESALALSPEAARHAWLLRVRASEDGELAEIRPRLQQSLRDAGDAPDAYLLDFALGTLLERTGDYPAAWVAYERGNRGRRRVLDYDPGEDAQFFADVCHDLNADFLSRHVEAGNPTELPIFIVGMPRSGTTLTERALGGHPRVREGGEMTALGDILRRHAGSKARHRLPLWLGECSTREIKAIGDEWFAALRQEAQGADRVTDKLPRNFAYLGLIKVCFPNATIVHVKRDPRDVLISSWTMTFDTLLRYSYDFEEFRAFYRGYRSVMEHWAQTGAWERFVEVEYRELVENFKPTVTGILEAAGLEWHPDCARFSERAGNVGTASLFQVRRSLYADSLGRWEHFREQLGSLADPQAWDLE